MINAKHITYKNPQKYKKIVCYYFSESQSIFLIVMKKIYIYKLQDFTCCL